jgi:hypothetical protein
LTTTVKARYVRLTNYRVPDGTFTLAGLRIFGNAGGKSPAIVKDLSMDRPESDRSIVKLNWENIPDATGYNIRYGIAKDKLYHTYQVLGTDSVAINSLNNLQSYYFTIDAFNESGISHGDKIHELH